MSEDEVIFVEENGVGIITLNRPDRLNALTYPMVQKINKYLNVWEKKEDINCVIIEGAGDRSFCAGGDVVKLRKEVWLREVLLLNYLDHFFMMNIL